MLISTRSQQQLTGPTVILHLTIMGLPRHPWPWPAERATTMAILVVMPRTMAAPMALGDATPIFAMTDVARMRVLCLFRKFLNQSANGVNAVSLNSPGIPGLRGVP
jgi:hypothetical protein